MSQLENLNDKFKKEKMVKNAQKASVTVFSIKGHGSGFLISSDGYVLTNAHVVGGAKFVQVKLITGTEKTGEVIRKDKLRDVALIKMESN